MRVTCWALLAAGLVISVYAEDVGAPTKDVKCVEPSIVAALETQVDDLHQSNAALQLQADSQIAEKSQLLIDVTKKHEAVVLGLKNEIAALKKDVEKLEKDVANEKKIVEKVEAELKTTLAKLNDEIKRTFSHESEITKLQENLTEEQAMVAKLDDERKAALSKLAEETKRTTQLKKDLEIAEKKNKTFMKELGVAKSTELTMATLLSSYYDDASKLAEQSVAFAQEKMNTQLGTFEQMQSKIGDVKKTVFDTTGKFYQANLAATLDPVLVNVRKTLDPILADAHKTVSPHVEKYSLIVQNEASKVKDQAVLYSQDALRRAKLARIEAITLLEQNAYVAAHAQKVIDGVLLILAVPLVLFQIRLALRLVWSLFTMIVSCCGMRKRTSKAKHKITKKAASVTATPNAVGHTKKTAAGKTASTIQKRSKRGKN